MRIAFISKITFDKIHNVCIFRTCLIIGDESMKNKLPFLMLITMFVLLLVSCNSSTKSSENLPADVNFEDLVIEDNFDYATIENINVELKVFNGANSGVANIPFKIYDKDPSMGGKLLDSGATSEHGVFSAKIIAPSYVKTLFVIGYMSNIQIPIVNNYASYEFGSVAYNTDGAKGELITPEKSNLTYLSPYNLEGVPSDMDFEAIPAGFLSKINTALPERTSVPVLKPHYLDFANEFNAVIVNEQAEVWITFVHEGAGHKNSFGFYIFDYDNPPTSAAEIGDITVVFPNVSMVGSGGGLVPGNKVFIGSYTPGTAIGWVLMSNGWSNGAAHLNNNTWYSDRTLNRTGFQQSILFYDDEYEKLVVGFEDLVLGQGDDDFNDAVFSVSAEPITSIDITRVTPIVTPDDTDGDGVPDMFDDFVNDPERAFQTNNHSMYTLAFEDLWPKKGDYDFNDLVIDYNVFYHKNADNKVKNVITEFEMRAVGAKFRNGFAIEFPFSAGNIESISIVDGNDPLTYSNIISDIHFAPVNEGGTKAVIVFIENTLDLMKPIAGSDFVNTEKLSPQVPHAFFALDIKLSTPENMGSWLWNAPFNPFIYVNQDRAREIHLIDYPNTPLANTALFGTEDDTSDGTTRYYKTINNLPWALNIATSWEYPYERNKITSAYLKFKEWAESSGTLYPDWYMNKPGYRNENSIYPN